MTAKSSKKEGAAKAAQIERPVPAAASAPTQIPLAFADGFGNVIMGPITTRLTLVLNVGPTRDGVQSTIPTLELVIPTPALLTFISQLQAHVKTQGPELSRALDKAKNQMMQIIGDYKDS